MLARKFQYDIFSEIRPICWGGQAIIKRKMKNQGDFRKISIEIPGRFLTIPSLIFYCIFSADPMLRALRGFGIIYLVAALA